MKLTLNKVITAIFAFSIFFLSSSFLTQISAAAEKIDLFDTYIKINSNGTIDVKESINYNFESLSRHGIYRDISFKKTNQDNKKYILDIKNIKVYDENGKSYTKEVSKEGNYVKIKIGDADKLVSGKMQYNIEYTVYGALTYFSDHDELYWNITGNEWTVPIMETRAFIELPKEIPNDQINVVCYTGSYGINDKNCTFNNTSKNIIEFNTKYLQTGEGLTSAVSFPKGFVTVLEPREDRSDLIQKILTTLFVIVYAWWSIVYPIKIFFKWLKDKKQTKNLERIVSAWFASPKTLDRRSLSPAETVALVTKTTNYKGITATIIDLAQRGFLKIKSEDKKSFSFEKLKDYTGDNSLADFEREILKAVFDGKDNVTLKDIQNSGKMINAATKFKEKIGEGLLKEKLFEEDIYKSEVFYNIIGVLGAMTVNLILTFVAFIFGRKSAKRTVIGVEKYSEAVSLKNFLVSQDEQLNFQSENQMFFEKLLPYATAFGVEKVWAKRFESLEMKPTDWYDGDLANIYVLSNMSNSIGKSVSTAMTPTRSSSGFSSGFSGGFSGGGGGGGGGGSW